MRCSYRTLIVFALSCQLALSSGIAFAQTSELEDRFRRAGELYGQGRVREAAEQLEPVLAQAPDYGPAIFLRGKCCFFLAEYATARSDLERSLGLGAPRDDCLEFLAHMDYYFGDYAAARRRIDEIRDPAEEVHFLRRAMDGPFRGRWGRAADRLEGRTKKNHYLLSTDIGVKAEEMDALTQQVTALEERGRDGEARLQKLLRKTPAFEHVDDILEQIYEVYSSVFDFGRKDKLVYRVILLNSRQDFIGFSSTISHGDHSDAAGYYSPQIKALVLFNDPDGVPRDRIQPYAQGTLFHEGFHQFLHAYLDRVPSWFDEGMAEYFATTVYVSRGNVRVGIVEKSSPDHRTTYQTILESLQPNGTIRPMPLRSFMLLDQRAFDEPARVSLNYAQAWALVHYLMSAPKGKALLKAYFDALKSGADAQQAFDQAFGKVDIGALDKAWRDYVLKL